MLNLSYSKFWSPVFDTLEDFVFSLDKNFNFIRVNKSFLKFIKKKKEEIIGKKCYEVVHGEKKPHKGCPYRKMLKSKKFESSQFYEPLLKRWLFISTTPIFDRGKLLGSIHLARDITDLKKTEKELREEKNRLHKYCNIIGTILVIIDSNQRVTFINKRGCKILGYRKEEIIGKNWFNNFLPRRVRAETKIVFEKLMAGKISQFRHYENPILTKKGKERIIIWHSALLKDRKGKIIATLSSGQDITDLKKAEKSLRENERKYREIFQLAPEAIIILDKKGQVLDVNNRVYEWLNYKPEEVIGKHILKLPFLPIKSKVKAMKKFSQRILGEDAAPYELEFIAKGGERKVGVINANLIKDAQGRINGDLVMISDTTEQKKAEEAIRRNQQIQAVINSLLRLSLENIPLEQVLKKALDFILSVVWLYFEKRACIFLVDKDSKKLVMKAQYGLPKSIQKRCSEISFGECLCGRTALTKKIQFVDSLNSFHKKKGLSSFHTHWCIPIISGKSKLLGVINLYLKEKVKLDKTKEEFIQGVANALAGIIERHQAEEELRESRAFIERTLEMAQGIIMVLDKKGNIIDVNRYIESLTGYKKEEFIGKNWLSIFLPNQKDIRGVFKRYFLDGVGGYQETTILTKDKKELVISWYASLINDDKGNFIAMIIMGVDVTYRKEMEKVQRLAQLGKLVSDMAHEVNNPLMVISGRAQLSLMEELKPEVKRSLEIIMQECQRAKDIIQRLLLFSKPSKGEIKKVDINKSIEDVILLIEHQFNLANIQIKRNYTKTLPLVEADEKQLQEVFINLLNNSKEAMPKGGAIEVETVKEGGFIRIDFKDRGVGMSQENLKNIMEPFFTTKEKGTGLGLSVCDGIIRAHQGKLKFKSKEGEGTTATILLPLNQGGDSGRSI